MWILLYCRSDLEGSLRALSLRNERRLAIMISLSLFLCSFFSTLLTAVLSHHLAWVYTVSRTNDARHARNSKSVSTSQPPSTLHYKIHPRTFIHSVAPSLYYLASEASLHIRTNGAIFLYYIYIYLTDAVCTYRNVLRDCNFAKLQYSVRIIRAPLRSPKMPCIRSSTVHWCVGVEIL